MRSKGPPQVRTIDTVSLSDVEGFTNYYEEIDEVLEKKVKKLLSRKITRASFLQAVADPIPIEFSARRKVVWRSRSPSGASLVLVCGDRAQRRERRSKL